MKPWVISVNLHSQLIKSDLIWSGAVLCNSVHVRWTKLTHTLTHKSKPKGCYETTTVCKPDSTCLCLLYTCERTDVACMVSDCFREDFNVFTSLIFMQTSDRESVFSTIDMAAKPVDKLSSKSLQQPCAKNQ